MDPTVNTVSGLPRCTASRGPDGPVNPTWRCPHPALKDQERCSIHGGGRQHPRRALPDATDSAAVSGWARSMLREIGEEAADFITLLESGPHQDDATTEAIRKLRCTLDLVHRTLATPGGSPRA